MLVGAPDQSSYLACYLSNLLMNWEIMLYSTALKCCALTLTTIISTSLITTFHTTMVVLLDFFDYFFHNFWNRQHYRCSQIVNSLQV